MEKLYSALKLKNGKILKKEISKHNYYTIPLLSITIEGLLLFLIIPR